jgi:hypothetical protein
LAKEEAGMGRVVVLSLPGRLRPSSEDKMHHDRESPRGLPVDTVDFAVRIIGVLRFLLRHGSDGRARKKFSG